MHGPLTSSRSGPLRGRVRAPGDKSISHRALILGGLSIGETTIEGLLEGEDVLATAAAMRALGASVAREGTGVWRVVGRGVGGLSPAAEPLDFGNSGTGARLMMGVVAGYDFATRFVGDASLSRRPMRRVLEPLGLMGACVEDGAATLPLTLTGTPDLTPITYRLPTPSAQVKSAILLAGLHASGLTTVVEPEPTRDHTERMLRHFGAEISVEDRADGRTVTVRGDADLHGRHVSVPGDPSSAAFFAAAAAITPGSDVLIEHVLVNPTRTGFYETLAEMGADIVFENGREDAGEPVADIRVRWAPLRGVEVPPERAPSMIDEYPMLAALSAYAAGATRMRGLSELRVKESDRLASTAAALAACGIEAAIEGDDLIVTGARSVRGGGHVETHLDHRIAMAFLTLGLASERAVTIDASEMIATSFPNFADAMSGLGARIEDAAEAGA
jgi:3-phosphoshikimate 1-carboxyvinyltransferase